jgi:transposase
VEQIAGVVAAGGEVWMGDETMLREFPPLRASWSRRGEQKRVVITGRNPYRVLLGALNVVTGQVVRLVRERCRTADTQAFVEELGRVRPEVPKLLVWDNAPPHHPKLVQQAAEAAHIQIAFLPFRAPELMPCEDLWRQRKRGGGRQSGLCRYHRTGGACPRLVGCHPAAGVLAPNRRDLL